MLQVSNVTKNFGDHLLFEGATFSLIPGERLGLVGRNGSGKTTLFKMIIGHETPDEGSITVPRGYTMGHLAQHFSFTEHTVLGEACLGLKATGSDERYKAEIILHGLGFAASDFVRAPQDFSGGYQIRINLAKLLLSEPNLLLLDEPTNYLDIVSIRWLQEFLRSWPGELIMVSHDRLFMDSVCTHTMLIHRGMIKKIAGSTAKLYEQVEQEERIYEKTRQNEDKKREQLELFISRFRAQASKAAMVQSKMKALEKMGRKEQLRDEETLEFRFQSAPYEGKVMGEAHRISFAYDGGPTLISDLTLPIHNGDRIAVIGKNGKGKSTLLRLLAGELQPNGGSISFNPNVRVGYFGQTNINRLNGVKTIEQEIFDTNPRLTRTQVRGICGAMMFSGDDALKKINVLSGGEKSRVLLGKLLAEPSNILLLDEPTNHLDMDSIEAIKLALSDYGGAVIIVTHSELLLETLAERLVIFEGERPEVFDFDYAYFLQKRGWSDERSMTQHAGGGDAGPTHLVEKRIAALEAQQLKIEADLVEAYGDGDEDRAQSLLQRLSNVEKDLVKLFEQL